MFQSTAGAGAEFLIFAFKWIARLYFEDCILGITLYMQNFLSRMILFNIFNPHKSPAWQTGLKN